MKNILILYSYSHNVKRKLVKCPNCNRVFFTSKIKGDGYYDKPQCSVCGHRLDPDKCEVPLH
jgi:hypothetical protein